MTRNHLLKHEETNKNMVTLGWPLLIKRKSKKKLTMLNKIRTGLTLVTHKHLVIHFRKLNLYVLLHSGADANLISFFLSTIRLWNSIPSELRTCPSLACFKDSLEEITITQSYTN